MTPARPADRLATPALIRLWCGVLAFFLSFFLLLPTVPLYARALGVPESQVGLLVGAFPIAAMLLRPVAGWSAAPWRWHGSGHETEPADRGARPPSGRQPTHVLADMILYFNLS